MKLFSFAVLLFTSLARCQGTVLASSSHDAQATLLVRHLYQQVVSRNPNDIPTGKDWEAFSSLMSTGLRSRMQTAKACALDQDKHNSNAGLVRKIAGRFRIFTGGRLRLTSFKIGKTEAQKDGAFRVFVTLKPPSWRNSRVAAVVIPENGHYTLDEVVYLDDNQWGHEEDRRNAYLSHYLRAGCDSARWTGELLPLQPSNLAKSLYANVMAHVTSGIPEGEDWKILSPYLGQSLLHQIDIYDACIADEQRYEAARKGPPEKLESLDEFGIFSGGDEEEAPRTVNVERSIVQKGGTVRVTVKLGLPQYELVWRVIDVFEREHGRFVLKDIIFPGEFFTKGVRDDRPPGPDAYLSKNLTELCNGGTHWTGYK